MIRKIVTVILLALAAAVAATLPAKAQQANLYCFSSTPPTWQPCSAALPLNVTSGGGGGGLSVVDQTAWTQATSPFTPTGGVFNDAATLSSGQEGTLRLTTKRAAIVDTDTSGNALYSAITAAVPWLATTAWDTNMPFGNGTTNAGIADLHSAPFVDIGAVGGSKLVFGQAVMASSIPVAIASNQSAIPVTTGAADPCQTIAHSFSLINQSASGLNSTPVVAGTSAKKTYVCQIFINTNAANNVAVFESSGGACAAGQVGMWGGTTAATGFLFAANSGLSIGSGGYRVAATTVNANDICTITSAATQLSGRIEWVQQ